MTDVAADRRPGRPRSEQADQAIIDATLELFGERGVEGVCVEAVAARAGVGKATIYRRWPGKEDLLIAALASLKRPLPEPLGDSAREDLVRILEVIVGDADDPRYARQFAMLHGDAENYPRLLARYTAAVVEPRRDLIRRVLRRGVETGELRAGLDVEIALLTLTGAVMSRGKHDKLPAAPGFAASIVEELMLGLRPR
jgi:AcrR family transcriptional regulator